MKNNLKPHNANFYLNQIRWTLARNRLELLVDFKYSTGIVRSFETTSSQAMSIKFNNNKYGYNICLVLIVDR